MKRFARLCRRHGWRAAAFSYWRFDFGETRDIECVVDHIHKMNPRAPLIGVAWSAGGSVLMKYLGVAGKNTPFVAAICVSGCFDFLQACSDVRENDNAAYTFFLTLQAKKCARRHLKNDTQLNPETKRQLQEIVDNFGMQDPLLLYDKWQHVIGEFSNAPRNHNPGDKYKFLEHSAEHFKANAINSMTNVRVSTLLMQSDDDVIVSGTHIDYDELTAKNKHLIVLKTKRGGHCSWYEGIFPVGKTWGDRIASRFISAVLESHSHTHFLVDVIRRSLKSNGQNQDAELSPESIARICSSTNLATYSTSPRSKRI